MKKVSDTTKWRIKNPEKARKKYERDWARKKSGVSYRYFNLRSHSKQRGRQFLSRDDFEKWFLSQEKVCCYCGVPEEVTKNIYMKSLHIDRKDNSVGYLSSNMVLACFVCNSVKGMFLSYDEMLYIGKEVISKRWNIKSQ